MAALPTPPHVTVEEMRADDWEAVRAIYEAGIATGDATFETAAPSWEEWTRTHLSTPRLVARENGRVVGWAALSPVSSRCVYEGVAESSVYVAPSASRRGIGHALLSALVSRADSAGIWTIQAGIFPENDASLALHARCGFRVVGVRERLGRHNGRWRDVVFLERRRAVDPD